MLINALWRKWFTRDAIRDASAPRPTAVRAVILEEGRATPSGDYLLLPWLERLGLPLLRLDLREAAAPTRSVRSGRTGRRP